MIRSKSSEITLRYDGKTLAAVSCPIVVRSKLHPRPVFAFIDKTWLSNLRSDLKNMGAGNNNGGIHIIQSKR
jgi:hypothetical protein